MKCQLNRDSGGEEDQLFNTETKDGGSSECGLPHPITPSILLTPLFHKHTARLAHSHTLGMNGSNQNKCPIAAGIQWS